MKVWGQGNWPSLISIRNSKKTNRTSCQIKCNWFKNHWRCWSVTPFRLPAEVAKSDEQLNTGKGQAHWHSQDWSHSINTKQSAPTRSTSVSEPYLFKLCVKRLNRFLRFLINIQLIRRLLRLRVVLSLWFVPLWSLVELHSRDLSW